MYTGLILMFVTFFIYLFGIIDPLIPLEHTDSFWNQPVQDYLIQINNEFLGWDEPPLGWSWIKLLGFGDFLNFLPVALLPLGCNPLPLRRVLASCRAGGPVPANIKSSHPSGSSNGQSAISSSSSSSAKI